MHCKIDPSMFSAGKLVFRGQGRQFSPSKTSPALHLSTSNFNSRMFIFSTDVGKSSLNTDKLIGTSNDKPRM